MGTMTRVASTRGIMNGAAMVAAVALGLAGAAAPLPAAAQSGSFGLELNNLEDIEGNCRLTFLANNATGVALEATSYEVVVFDAAGTVSQRLILEFGRLPENKTKVVQFLLDRACNQISRLLLNDVEDCIGADGQALPYCLDALVTSSRVDVQFGA